VCDSSIFSFTTQTSAVSAAEEDSVDVCIQCADTATAGLHGIQCADTTTPGFDGIRCAVTAGLDG